VQLVIWYVFRDNKVDMDWQSGIVYAKGKKKPSYTMYQRPISLSATSIKKGKIVTVWGASTRYKGTQRIEFSYNGKRGWKKLAKQTRDNRNGSVTARVRPATSVWFRVRDSKGPGLSIKLTVK
jgi:hypothetical protein